MAGPEMPPPPSGGLGGQAADVGRDEAENPAGGEEFERPPDGLARPGGVFDEVDHGHGLVAAGRKGGFEEVALAKPEAVFFSRPSDGPAARFDAVDLPAPAAGQVSQNPRRRPDVEEFAPGRPEALQPVEEDGEVSGPSRGLLVIERVLDLAVERNEEVSGGAGVGEQMAAAQAEAQVPDFAVFLVRDLDLVRAQARGVERSLPVRPETGAEADRAPVGPEDSLQLKPRAPA